MCGVYPDILDSFPPEAASRPIYERQDILEDIQLHSIYLIF
jgi:hypothetical protein